MPSASPSTVDHTPKPTEIVSNVAAWGNVNQTFVVTIKKRRKRSIHAQP